MSQDNVRILESILYIETEIDKLRESDVVDLKEMQKLQKIKEKLEARLDRSKREEKREITDSF